MPPGWTSRPMRSARSRYAFAAPASALRSWDSEGGSQIHDVVVRRPPERVADLERVAFRMQAVEPEVLLRVGERVRRDVHGDHAPRTRCSGVHREPARVGEEVRHAEIAGPARDGSSVLALVEEQARLLSRRRSHEEAQPVLLDDERLFHGRARQVDGPRTVVDPTHAELPEHGRVRVERLEDPHDERKVRLPRARVDPNDEHRSVAIDHQPAEAVARPVHQSVRVRRIGHDALAKCSRVGQSSLDEPVERLGMACQHVDGDVAVVREPERDGPTAPVHQPDRGARGRSTHETLGVDPRMPAGNGSDGFAGQCHGVHYADTPRDEDKSRDVGRKITTSGNVAGDVRRKCRRRSIRRWGVSLLEEP